MTSRTSQRIPRDTIVHLTSDSTLKAGPATGRYPIWPFTQHKRWRWRCERVALLDPINVMVIGWEPHRILDVLAGEGWNRPDDGATHRTWFGGQFRTMSDHSALGTRAERVHARFFAMGNVSLIAAHHEVQNDRGKHIVTSWDRARTELADALERLGFIPLGPTEVVLPTNLRGVPGDGRVWRFSRPPPRTNRPR